MQVRPELMRDLRIIGTLGPSPIPPWVITTNVPAKLREEIRRVFYEMHTTAAGRAILAQGQIQRMARVEDKDYNPIREMALAADKVIW